MVELFENPINTVAETLSKNAELTNNLLQPVCNESGKVIGRIPRVINALLSGVDCWCIDREAKIKEIQILTAKKLQALEDDKIVQPDEHILIPLLQSFLYSMDCEEIKKMYANLLASEMTKDKKQYVHPAFVETIRQLSPLDALNLNIFKKNINIAAVEPLATFEDEKGRLFETLCGPIFFQSNQNVDLTTIEKQSMSISLLCRLGLIFHAKNHTLAGREHYDKTIIDNLYSIYNKIYHGKYNKDFPYLKYLGIEMVWTFYQLTEFGRAFIQTCL